MQSPGGAVHVRRCPYAGLSVDRHADRRLRPVVTTVVTTRVTIVGVGGEEHGDGRVGLAIDLGGLGRR